MFASTEHNSAFPGQCSFFGAVTFRQNPSFTLKLTSLFGLKLSDFQIDIYMSGLMARDTERQRCWSQWELHVLNIFGNQIAGASLSYKIMHTCLTHEQSCWCEAASIHTMKYINLCRIETISLWFACLVLNLKPVSLENIVFASCKR